MTRWKRLRRAATVAGLSLSAMACGDAARSTVLGAPGSPLRLARTIALPAVGGRIDHLAVDLARQMLFVAEYANGTVDVIDLAAGKAVDRITGLKQPQGIGVTLDGAQLVVACGDGTVHFYRTDDRRAVGTLVLGNDADNVRIDARQGHVVIGYGGGGLAIVDPATRKLIRRVALPAHPEGFRITGSRAIVNLPDRGEIAAVDLDTGQIGSVWGTGAHHLNFPLITDPAGKWFAIAYRFPAALELRSQRDGAFLSRRSACGDADDLFLDRDRFYVICGAGRVDVMPVNDDKAATVAVTTAPGARTGLFVPELHALFIARPARVEGAAILELTPQPGAG